MKKGLLLGMMLICLICGSAFAAPAVTDGSVTAWIGENGVPFSIIFTKCDKQSAAATSAQIEKDRAILLQDWEELPPLFTSSSAKKTGREEILAYIDSLLSGK